MHGWESG